MKKFRFTAIVLAVVLCVSFFSFNFGTVSKVHAESDWELHYWNFDDSLNDANGGYNLIGDAVYAEGKNGKALNTAEMTVAPKSDKLTCNTLNGFTMGAWIYINDGADFYSIIMSKGNTGSTDYDRFQIHVCADAAVGGAYLYVYSPATRGNAYPSAESDGQDATVVIPYETWTHVATTWDGNLAKVFVNGDKVFEVAIEHELADSLNAYQNLRIGALNDGTTFKFDGLLDDEFYANYAMTEADVKKTAADDGPQTLTAWANGTAAITPAEMRERVVPEPSTEVAEPESGLIFYWPFENNYQDLSHKELDFDFDDMEPDFDAGKVGQGVFLEDTSICTDFFDESVDFTEFTLSLWFRWDGIQAGTLPYYIIAALGDKAQDYHFELYIKSDDCEKGSLCIYNPGGLVANDMLTVVPGELYHVVMVNSASNGFQTYVNGEVVYSRGTPCNIAGLASGEQKFTLGALQDYSLLSYGIYDEVILATYAFSDDLIAKLYSDPAAAAEDVAALVKANYPEDYARATPKPTAEPTEVPTEAPATEVPSENPATEVPAKATSKPAGDKNADKDSGSAVTIIIIVAAVIVAAIVAAIIAVLKKKKK